MMPTRETLKAWIAQAEESKLQALGQANFQAGLVHAYQQMLNLMPIEETPAAPAKEDQD